MDLTKKEIEEIITYEVVVDCYDEFEMRVGWAIYMGDNINYPFTADYEVKSTTGKKSIKNVKVIRNYSDESNFSFQEYLVEIDLDGMVIPVNIEALKNISANIETLRVLQVWGSRNSY